VVAGAGTGATTGATEAETPERILTVESSRNAVPRPVGRFPCQPEVGVKGMVRRSVWRALGVKTNGGCSPVDDLGLNEASMVKESKIPWADYIEEKFSSCQ